MDKNIKKDVSKKRIHNRVRSVVIGTAVRPRMSVFFSLKHSYVQLIDDENSKTLISANDKELKLNGKNIKIAEELGKLIAKKAKEIKIENVVFDRGSKKYHGKVKALADTARAEGLNF
ncbi:MAG: 50S ribosomal protein L18 [Patescibacteria group bacterium]|nr:50S ribosomal protein L18 [Patescibacteria group bacterium]MDD4304624.1 50S ribosomal protein L18 [Patescibacteria group bacterium]MDD4695551.1 50S ribosomal protein L18 [Patescibacteria group bacterium]